MIDRLSKKDAYLEKSEAVYKQAEKALKESEEKQNVTIISSIGT